jgi:hypothetical protein
MSDLYNTDIVLWSKHQADLLHRMGKGASMIRSIGRTLPRKSRIWALPWCAALHRTLCKRPSMT